ncbi:MAG: hypothetical protein Q7S01_03845 [bacterium]|nr:hypothetical protein [bacterium]
MSNGERKHGHGLIDLRKRRAGEQARAARARAQASLPLNRRTSLRVRRRKLQALLVLAFVVAAVGASYGISELSYLSRYSIREVKVKGTENVSPRLVQAYVETKLNNGTRPIISRDNIFLYPKADIAQSIQNYFPRILSADISRESLLAQAITVSVTERKLFALWCSEKELCFEMDDTGFIFAESSTTTSGIVFKGGLATSSAPIGQTFFPGHFSNILAFLSRLKDSGFSVVGVAIENEQDFMLTLSKGFDVRSTIEQDANTIVRNLQTVLMSQSLSREDKIEYIDLRFGNRVYYKNR